MYDLKGSKMNRFVSFGENQTMKDLNLLSCKKIREDKQIKGLLQFEPKRDIKKLKQIIKKDSEFMRNLGLMDYSLLLAVENIKDPKNVLKKIRSQDFSNSGSQLSPELSIIAEKAKSRHHFNSTCGRYVYHIAVIDFLTRFNFHKRCESYYKTTIKNRKKYLVSCVEPNLYAKRFNSFIMKEVIVNETINREKEIKLDRQSIKDFLFDKIYSEFIYDYTVKTTLQ